MRFICAFYVIIVCDKPHIISAEDLKVKGLFALRRDPSECENCTGCHPEEQYKVKIRTAAARDELPDIFIAWEYSFAEDFVKAGKALKMGPYHVNAAI